MQLLTNRPGANPLPADAERAVAAANEAIFSRSQRSEKLNGMGTTLVALLAEERQAWMLNVGDSRGYRLRNSKLEQITLDHSLVEEQMRLGQMSEEEALRSPLKNVITRALGTQSLVTPDVFELETEPGDLFLLCTDGLTRELSDALLESCCGLICRLMVFVRAWSLPLTRPEATTTSLVCWSALTRSFPRRLFSSVRLAIFGARPCALKMGAVRCGLAFSKFALSEHEN